MEFLDESLDSIRRELELEHLSKKIYFDYNAFTLLFESKDRTEKFETMGSAENIFGYTLATFLAFQKYFQNNDRPVPSFLLIDQPSQVYFPTT